MSTSLGVRVTLSVQVLERSVAAHVSLNAIRLRSPGDILERVVTGGRDCFHGREGRRAVRLAPGRGAMQVSFRASSDIYRELLETRKTMRPSTSSEMARAMMCTALNSVDRMTGLASLLNLRMACRAIREVQGEVERILLIAMLDGTCLEQ